MNASTASAGSAPTATSSATLPEVAQYAQIKDFYELLGVTKSSTDDEIKKNYRKLALKFHPDKCNVAGSQDIFQKIATAYDCLTNQDKRAAYDRYGTADNQPEAQYHNYRQQYHDEDVDPNDIFNFFFGNNSFFDGGAQRRQQFNNQRARQNNNAQEGGQQKSVFPTLFQLLPIILIVLSGPIFGSVFKEDPLYSMNYNWSYPQRRNTQVLNIPYFVGNDFREKAAQERGLVRKIEKEIEEIYIRDLRNTCFYQQQMKTQYLNQYRASRNQRQQEIYWSRSQKVDMRSCTKLDEISQTVDINQYL